MCAFACVCVCVCVCVCRCVCVCQVARQLRGQGVTLLVVAHQLRTVEEADHIVFMEGGAIVEQGTHLELMASEGRYHRSYQALF